jgi:hypothetical protein
MTDFAVNSVTIRADGWSADVVLAGQAGEQGNIAYDFGTPGSTSTSNFYIRVTSNGYNSLASLTPKTRYVYATQAVRLPYPNEASLDETDATTTMVVRVALSDYVFALDDIAGGSGADPQATIATGTFTNGADTNTAFFDASITNSSTVAYPTPHAAWDVAGGVNTADRVKGDYVLAVHARAPHGIAAVHFDATGQTSAVADTANPGTLGKTARTASGLYAESYQATIPLAQFTQGELITNDFTVYPTIGNASYRVLTTGSTTFGSEAFGQNELVVTCDKSDALDDAVYVSTSGNDSTGDGSSGTPYATISKGINNGNIIYLTAGTHAAVGASHTQFSASEWKVVQPAPGVAKSAAIVQIDATNRASDCTRLKYSGVTVTKLDTASFLTGDNVNAIWYDDCNFDRNGVGSASAGPMDKMLVSYMTNCTGVEPFHWNLNSVASRTCGYVFDGNVMTNPPADNSLLDGGYRYIANEFNGPINATHKPNTHTVAQTPLNNTKYWYAWNNAVGHDDNSSANSPLLVGNYGTMSIVCIVGNVVERIALAGANFFIGDDNQMTDVMVDHNTVAGAQCAFTYNKTGSSAVLYERCYFRNNSFDEYAIESDLFGTPDGGRVGNWAPMYGVGFSGNNDYGIITNGHEFPGLNHTEVDPAGYTDDQSINGGDAGGGDYTPATGSALLSRVASGTSIMGFDLFGEPVRDDGTGDIGAVQSEAASGGGNQVSITRSTTVGPIKWVGP